MALTWRGYRWRLGRWNVRRGVGYEINRREDTVANLILGTEPNAPIASASVLELHHLIMSKLGGHRGRLERDR